MPELGTQFAGYRIDGVVGRGGMGVVYRATELALDRPVALKLIAPELAGDASFRERFLRESRLAASIDHAGILPVYAAGEADGELYLANRFVDGTDLRALLEHGPLPAERALGLVGQVADALDAAHAQGLVHRDVKPGNVLVDAADHCYLSDFGLTTQLRARDKTASGVLTGTLDYLAPEQIRRGEVDGRTDQYALGCMLYELLSGAPPFRRETEAQTLWAHMQEEPSPLAAYPELDPVFARALAKEPEERYESCDAFVDDARAALGLGPSPVAVRRRRRRIGGRLLYGGVALIVLAAVAAVLALTLRSNEALVASPNSLGVVDPVSQELVQAIPVGNTPTEVAASDDWVWVVNSNDGAGTISRIDPETQSARVDVLGRRDASEPPRPHSARSGSGRPRAGSFASTRARDLVEESWTLPNAGEESLFELDQGAGWLAAGPNAVWAGSLRTISRIDPATSRDGSAAKRGLGADGLWIRLALGPRRGARAAVARDDATCRDRRAPGGWPTRNRYRPRLGLGRRRRWSRGSRRPTGGGGLPHVRLVGSPFGVAVGAEFVWAASEAGTLARIDPRTDGIAVVPVGGAPRGVDVGAGAVWTSVN